MLLEGLLALIAAFVVITVVGHLFWLISAALLKALFASEEHDPARRPASTTPHRQMAEDLPAFARMVAYFRWKGWISEQERQQFDALGTRVEAELAGSRAETSTPQAVAGPVDEEVPGAPSLEGNADASAADGAGGTADDRAAASQVAPEVPAIGAAAKASSIDVPTEVDPLADDRSADDPFTAEEEVSGVRSPAAARSPRRAMSEVLQSFLEAHNIRWGELVAGILIVVCSIGLVVSLWNTLTAANRLLPAAVFLTAVGAIEGAGLYTLRRWRLRHTSRAVLMIATMLVPLSMMAGISIAGSGEAAIRLGDPQSIAAVLAGGLLCLGMVFASGSALVGPQLRWHWTAVIGIPTILLPLASAGARGETWWSPWLMAVAGICVSLTLMLEARRVYRQPSQRRLLKGRRWQFASLLGLAAYAVAVLLAMYVVRGARRLDVLVPVLLSTLPTLVGLAALALEARRRIGGGSSRVVFGAIGAVAALLALAVLPPSLQRFGWVSLWALALGLSGLTTAVIVGRGGWGLLGPVAAALWAPLAASVWWEQQPWQSEFPLWRRYLSGNAMVAVMAIAAIDLLVAGGCRLWRLSPERSWWRVGVATLAAGLLLGTGAGLGPSAWLDSLPRGAVVLTWAWVALAAAVVSWREAQAIGLCRLAVWIAAAVALFHFEQWWRMPRAQWAPSLLAWLGVASLGQAFAGELAAWRDWRLRRDGWRWAGGTALLALAATMLAFGGAPQAAIAWSVTATLLLTIAALRTGRWYWLSTAQLASVIALGCTLTYRDPIWLRRASAWVRTDSGLYLLTWFTLLATGWSLLSVAFVSTRTPLSRAVRRDRWRLEWWGSLMALGLWGVLAAINLVRGYRAHVADASLPTASLIAFVASAAALWSLTLVRGRLLGGRVAGRYAGRGRPLYRKAMWSRIAAERWLWLVAAAALSLVAAVWATHFVWQSTARGMVAHGWVALGGAAAAVAGFAMVRGWQRRRRRVAMVVLSGLGLVPAACAGAALLMGPHGLRATGATLWQWLPLTLSGWALTVAGVWGALSWRIDRRWPAAVGALSVPLCVVYLTRWWYGEAPAMVWLSGAVAGAFLARTAADVARPAWFGQGVGHDAKADFSTADVGGRADGLGAPDAAVLDAGWRAAVGHCLADCRRKPCSVIALLAGALTALVVVAAIPLALLPNARVLAEPAVWCGLWLATVLIAARWFPLRQAKVAAVGATILAGSGLLTLASIEAGWVAVVDARFLMAASWLGGGLLVGAAGIGGRSVVAVTLAGLVAVAVAIVGWWENEASWRWLAVAGGASVVNVVLGLATALTLKRSGLGQSISAAGWLTGLGVVWLLPTSSLTQLAAMGCWTAGLGLAWHRAALVLPDAATAGGARQLRDPLRVWLPEVTWVFAAGVLLRTALSAFEVSAGGKITGGVGGLSLLSAAALASIAAAQPRSVGRAERLMGLVTLLVMIIAGWAWGTRGEAVGVVTSLVLAAGMWAILAWSETARDRRGQWSAAGQGDAFWTLCGERSAEPTGPLRVALVSGVLTLLTSFVLWQVLQSAEPRATAPLWVWAVALLGPPLLRRLRFFEATIVAGLLHTVLLAVGPLAAATVHWDWLGAGDAWRVWAAGCSITLAAALAWSLWHRRQWAMSMAAVIAPATALVLAHYGRGWGVEWSWWALVVGVLTMIGPLAWYRLGWRGAIQWYGLLTIGFVVSLVDQLQIERSLEVGLLALWLAAGATAWRLAALEVDGRSASLEPRESVAEQTSTPGFARRLRGALERMWVDQLWGLLALLLSATPALSVFAGARGPSPELTFLLSFAVAATMAANVLLRLWSPLAVASAFAAVQVGGAGIVAASWPRGWDVLSVAGFASVSAVLAGLWVWFWPLVLYFGFVRQRAAWSVGKPIGYRLPGRRAGVAMLLLTASVLLGLAATLLLRGVEPTSRWLLIAAVTAMSPVIGGAARWYEDFAAVNAAAARMLRDNAARLLLVAVVLFALGLDPSERPWWLLVTMRLLVAATLLPPLAIWLAPRLPGMSLEHWQLPLRGLAWQALALGLLVLPAMIGQEFWLRDAAGIPGVPLALVIGIAVLLAAAAVMAAVAGLLRPRELRVLPELSERQRRLALYAAQLLGLSAWLHVFLCRPQLALAGLRPYWPYLVMGLAFLSAGLAQWGRSRRDPAVSATLRQTSLFLPLIPVIGFWLSSSGGIWEFGGGAVPYAWLLLLAAAFYGGLAVLWRSDWLPRIAGLILANAALWVVLVQYPSLAFVRHPQFWLIPPAVCVLGVAQLERSRLDRRLLAAIRYGCALTIYISSTADVLLGEIGETLMGPVLLIVVALCGMVAGVIFKTRAFLYLGTLFVLVGVLSMVWHAGRAIDQNWPWWVFGITTGCLILAALMAIEKNKPRLQEWVRRLGAWDA